MPDGPPMRKGDSGSRVATLRNRLLVSGDLEEVNEQHSDLFDDEMVWRSEGFRRDTDEPSMGLWDAIR